MNGKRILLYVLTFIGFGIIIYALSFFGASFVSKANQGKHFIQNIYSAQDFARINEGLAIKNRELEEQLVGLREIEEENEFLRSALQAQKVEREERYLLASVIGQGSAFGNDTIVIDKGLRDGLSGGEPVIINPRTLVGRIGELFETRAVVYLLFDKDFRIPASTGKETQGVVKGQVGNQVLFSEVSQAASLQKDEIILTNNENPSIPPDIIIGKVREIVSQSTDIFQEAQLDVFFNKNTLDRVFIINL
jgi:cell shape-determining protein MreC